MKAERVCSWVPHTLLKFLVQLLFATTVWWNLYRCIHTLCIWVVRIWWYTDWWNVYRSTQTYTKHEQVQYTQYQGRKHTTTVALLSKAWSPVAYNLAPLTCSKRALHRQVKVLLSTPYTVSRCWSSNNLLKQSESQRGRLKLFPSAPAEYHYPQSPQAPEDRG